MIGLDQLTVVTNKGREYAYLGMYEEAISNFESAVACINNQINKRAMNLNLKGDWQELLKQILKEQDLCRCLGKPFNFMSLLPSFFDLFLKH